MKTIKMSKAMMDKLIKNGQVWGKLYVYTLHEIRDENFVVVRYPVYYNDGHGRRFNTLDYAKRNHPDTVNKFL